MPGKTREELPPNLKKILPPHAQEIYSKAHDNALEQYADPHRRRGSATLEETAHRVAWAAVEKEYEKNESGDWVRKS